jgi:hypothetical protein
MIFKKKWLIKFLPAEIIGTITAVGSASITHICSDNGVLVAYAGSLGEAIGFYSTILIQNILSYKSKNDIDFNSLKINDFTKIISKLVIEFGPAGMIDGLLLRPFFMYAFPILIENFTLGLFIGKIVGDITFYLLVIITTEIKEKIHKRN